MHIDHQIPQPKLIDGGLSVDDRGQVSFINGFGFGDVKRFYMVSNHAQGFVRAWHGHKREGKYVLVVKGAAIIAAVPIDDWERPSKDAPVQRYVLSEKKPTILYIPPGHANGFMSLTADAQIMFFSTSTLDESLGDDIRFDARYWDVWSVVER